MRRWFHKRRVRPGVLCAVALGFFVVRLVSAQPAPVDPLPGWNGGPAKSAILDFVTKVTRPGGSEFVPIPERIATFDNDGTSGRGLVHHTDAEREWAYDRTSHIGKLDKALDEATSRKWVVVDMKQDWKVIYPPQK